MTPKQMVELFREHAFDPVPQPKWSDALILAYLTEAEQQAALRARLYEDVETPEVCRISVKANKQTYDVDPRVLFIRRVKIAAMVKPLPKADLRDLDAKIPDWDTLTAEQPQAWVPWGNLKLKLVPTPTVDAVLTMSVVRLPLEDMTLTGEAPELSPHLHPRLVDYALGKAFDNQDTDEKARPAEALRRFAMFDAEFGPPRRAVMETWIRRRHGYDDYEGLE